MSGLEYMEAIRTGQLPPPPIGVLFGLEPLELGHGKAAFGLQPAEYHYNPIGAVHGGVTSGLLDTVMAVSIHTTLPADVGYTTLELKVNFIRPVTVDTGYIRATGEVVHRGSRIATAQGRIESDDGKLIAHGTTTCIILGG